MNGVRDMKDRDHSYANGAGQAKEEKKLKLNILGPPGGMLTEEQQAELARERKRRATARRATLHRWTDEKIVQYIQAFQTRRPNEYAEYVRQEIDRSEIEANLALEMDRFASSMFPHASLADVVELKGKVRDHVRNSLGLKWEK
jgi:hypothetical protein